MIVDTLWIVIAQLVVTLYLVVQVIKLRKDVDAAIMVIGYMLVKTGLNDDDLLDKDLTL